MRILIAEDDPTLADGLAASLRESGYSVDRVATGADGAIASFEFDLLILDLGLPKMGGPEELKARVRALTRRGPGGSPALVEYGRIHLRPVWQSGQSRGSLARTLGARAHAPRAPVAARGLGYRLQKAVAH